MIVDEGSANGTAVNGIRLVKGERRLLKPNDELVLGFPNASSVQGGESLDQKQREGACLAFRVVAERKTGEGVPADNGEAGPLRKRKRVEEAGALGRPR